LSGFAYILTTISCYLCNLAQGTCEFSGCHELNPFYGNKVSHAVIVSHLLRPLQPVYICVVNVERVKRCIGFIDAMQQAFVLFQFLAVNSRNNRIRNYSRKVTLQVWNRKLLLNLAHRLSNRKVSRFMNIYNDFLFHQPLDHN